MVATAIALYSEKGEAAIQIFNGGKASGFVDGQVYIVVQSRGTQGKILAHAANARLVGTPLSEISDTNGLKFGELMSAEAKANGGWFEYDWLNPETGKVGRKRSWAVLYQDLVFVAGIYVRLALNHSSVSSYCHVITVLVKANASTVRQDSHASENLPTSGS